MSSTLVPALQLSVLSLYLFSLGLGGVLLAATLFADSDHHGADHDLGVDWLHVFSLRNATYFMFVFGAVGSLLHWLKGGSGTLGTALTAAGAALATSAIVHSVFGYLRRTDAPEAPGDADLVGLSGRVTVPVGGGGLGKIQLLVDGQPVELLARPFDPSSPDAADLHNGSEVVIVEMSGSTALVSRLSDQDA